MSEVYAFIEAEKTTHNVALLCRLLKVARSSFYAKRPLGHEHDLFSLVKGVGRRERKAPQSPIPKI
ncbi:hypothetical protein [Streptomyces sp. NPDC019539]|uniref:hypothetical protein n=1 Tax=Streptomyces sp. NPDC019539 TaxID=3365063 RepID=UPI0037A9A863